MNDDISHSGIVESIEDGCVRVRILQTSACAACKIAGHCHASESKEKIVEVRTTKAAGRQVGDEVTVCASRRVVSRAMNIGFVLPFLLMVLTLVVVLQLTGSEAKAGLSAVAVLVPYYVMVWLLRERIGRRVSFYIRD